MTVTRRLLSFGPFTLDARTRLLSKNGAPVPLGPTVIATLCVLAERAGELVTKDELMQRVWPERCVEESNLTQNVYRLRRALAAGGLSDAIETLPCRGYRFVARVAVNDAADAANPVDVPPHGAPVAHRSVLRRVAAVFAGVVAVMLLMAGVPRPQPVPAFARLSPESQRLYRLGRYHWNLRSDAAHVRYALRAFGEVARRDPRNPLGYAGLADAYLSVFDSTCESVAAACRRVVALASDNAREAVRRDPRSAEAHTSLAMVLNELAHDDARAAAEFERAITLDPRYALAHHWYGNALLVRGEFARADREHRAALALEPASPATYAWLAHDAFFARRYRDAIAFARESLAIWPRRHPTQVVLGLAYERVGDERAAIAVFDQLGRTERDALVAALLAREGRRAQARAMLRRIGPRQALGSGCTVPVALAWLALGDKTRAYAYMRATPPANVVERRFLAFDPRLDALRADPRFRPWTVPN